ncbi:MAG: NAD(P)-dependent oxidoreductase [Burkholderiaceae bacterium]
MSIHRNLNLTNNMHVTVFHPEDHKREQMITCLQSALPQADVNSDAAHSTDYLVAWAPPGHIFDSAPNIKACFSLGAGVDHWLSNGYLPAGLPLYRLEDAGMGDQMARYCRHETEHYRLLCWRYQPQQINHQWIEHEPVDPNKIRVGLFGFGVLGRQVAALLKADGYPVNAYRRSGVSDTSGDNDVPVFNGPDGLKRFLATTDVLILIAPLTPQTRNIINSKSLALLPRGAWLINVARGQLVNDDDLLAAVDSGQLAGASLDVFNTEPLPAEHGFWSRQTIRITPHVAALTRAAESASQIAEKIQLLSQGEQPGGLVITERGY